MTPASPSLSPRLLPVITLATISASLLVAVLTAQLIEPTLLHGWRLVKLVLGSVIVSSSLGLLPILLALRLTRWPLWLRTVLAVQLGSAHGALWLIWAEPIFATHLSEVAAQLLPVWVLSGVGGLVVGLVLVPALPNHARLTGPMVVGCSTALLLGVATCSLLLACLLLFLFSDGTTLHILPHPTAPITALVVSDSCGATCRCTVRVDLKAEHRSVREVYRGRDCDAEASWQSPVLLYIQDNDGEKLDLDIRTLGLSVP